MFEHTDVVTSYNVGPISFEPDSKLGVLGSLCESFGQFVFFLLPLIFLRVFG